MTRLISIIRRRPNMVHIITPIVASQSTYRLKWAANFDGSFATIIDCGSNGYVDPSIDLRKVQVSPGGQSVQMVFDPATFSIPDTSPFWVQYVPVTNGVEGFTLHAMLIGTVDVNTLTYGLGGTLDGLTLVFKIDGGSNLTVTFSAPVNRQDVLDQINAVLTTDALATYNGDNHLVVTSTTTNTGSTSKVKIVSGTGSTSLGLTNGTEVTGAATNVTNAKTLVLPDRAAVGSNMIIISGNAPNASSIAGSDRLDLPGQCQDMHIHNEHGSNSLYVAFDPGGPEMLIQAPDKDTQYNSVFGTHSSLIVRGSGSAVGFSATFNLANPR